MCLLAGGAAGCSLVFADGCCLGGPCGEALPRRLLGKPRPVVDCPATTAPGVDVAQAGARPAEGPFGLRLVPVMLTRYWGRGGQVRAGGRAGTDADDELEEAGAGRSGARGGGTGSSLVELDELPTNSQVGVIPAKESGAEHGEQDVVVSLDGDSCREAGCGACHFGGQGAESPSFSAVAALMRLSSHSVKSSSLGLPMASTTASTARTARSRPAAFISTSMVCCTQGVGPAPPGAGRTPF